MKTSVIIPVWNGATVIEGCLQALYAHTPSHLLEVICVDNASSDASATLIAQNYPQARLLSQPINLGFAGGVNEGLKAAQGDLFILLNQDCVVHAAWLTELITALEQQSEFGIVGCTIFNPDGTVNHAGAILQHPSAYSLHLTEIGDNRPRRVEYVTGAALAIRRKVWETIGALDDGFYPAYYEESDYCYRARRHGFEIGYVPAAKVTHLFSSREWQTEPIKHTANQHRSRFRFVSKHFYQADIAPFFEAEYAAIVAEGYQDQLVGRMIAARDTLQHFTEITARCQQDLQITRLLSEQRQFIEGFTQILRQSFARLETLTTADLSLPPQAEWESYNQQIKQTLAQALAKITVRQLEFQPPAPNEELEKLREGLRQLKQKEHDLLRRIYFKSPNETQPEPIWHRLVRLLIYRPLSFIIGRDYLLLAELNTVHVARLDKLSQLKQYEFNELHQLVQYQQRKFNELRWQLLETAEAFDVLPILQQLMLEYMTQTDWLRSYNHTVTTRRLKLLEILTDYEYR